MQLIPIFLGLFLFCLISSSSLIPYLINFSEILFKSEIVFNKTWELFKYGSIFIFKYLLFLLKNKDLNKIHTIIDFISSINFLSFPSFPPSSKSFLNFKSISISCFSKEYFSKSNPLINFKNLYEIIKLFS